MKLHESGEDYLETILLLQQRKGSVRSVDIANELNYSKPSISRAMGILKDAGYITMESSGKIELTDSGRIKADQVYERHLLITRFLMLLGVSKDVAETDACRIEHIISDETFDKLKGYIEKNA